MESITDRKKKVTVQVEIPADVSTPAFEVELVEWLKTRGYKYEGLVEVAYEEEQE